MLLKREPVQVSFESNGSYMVPYGTTVLEAAQLNKVELNHFCGGICSCSTCVVKIQAGNDNLSKMSPKEKLILGEFKAKQGMRLSCQTKIFGAVSLTIPEWF